MNILIVAGVPFESMRRRQQQVALGLTAREHEVLYLNPPRPFRSLVDPGRFELQELPVEEPPGTADDSANEVKEGPREICGVRITRIQEGLQVADKGVAAAAMGRWGWTTRTGWKKWAGELRQVLGALAGERQTEPAGFTFHPDVILVYHPALLAPLRASYDGPLIFDCVDDFPSLARSRSIAKAFEDVLTEGVPLVDGMIAVNRYILESWGRLLRSGAARQVVEHGVDLTLFRPPVAARTAAIRAALEIPADLKMICYLGRVDARISYEDIQTMMAQDEATIFLFVGEVGPEGRAIFQRLPGNRILPVGPIRPEQAADVVAGADLLIFPFRREPHLEAVRGLKLYEYLATGRPVVASFRRTLKAFRECIYLYATREELQQAYQTALVEPADADVKSQRLAIARDAGWDRRVASVEAFLKGVVAGS